MPYSVLSFTQHFKENTKVSFISICSNSFVTLSLNNPTTVQCAIQVNLQNPFMQQKLLRNLQNKGLSKISKLFTLMLTKLAIIEDRTMVKVHRTSHNAQWNFSGKNITCSKSNQDFMQVRDCNLRILGQFSENSYLEGSQNEINETKFIEGFVMK